ncbi:hypothetical protein [Bradyrhizobium sp. 188]|uniref:hypothetical protein n=1 Tax=Bradyrhizobium sp. 188 TaxID=2782656 RepID=UPI001FFBAB3E|nr:hypothetical protein [Bradyrhizobium sp. 188]MCK1501515.1 hypothetical protein [Bradyrhizobium sp. 188]
MGVHIVMDQTGDSRHTFNPADPQAVEEAEKRFKELTGAGFTAAERTGNGEAQVTRAFNKDATETLFFPRLKGG